MERQYKSLGHEIMRPAIEEGFKQIIEECVKDLSKDEVIELFAKIYADDHCMVKPEPKSLDISEDERANITIELYQAIKKIQKKQ